MKLNFLLKKEVLLLLAILCFAFFIRVYSLGVPPLWIDESISVNVAQKIIQKTIPVLDSGWNYNSSPLFHYAVAISVLIKDSEFFARFPSVIF
ncbi:MAG: hypothetical protein Q8N88_02970, partial [Nanoarchaeota archaeon]|nr:hypothetical protein [Nanoarchaeota archaeon]